MGKGGQGRFSHLCFTNLAQWAPANPNFLGFYGNNKLAQMARITTRSSERCLHKLKGFSVRRDQGAN